jgi:HTH-type transcriptional repressor of NAD biosynthesis genes
MKPNRSPLRVVIVGVESTGKTTLSENLAKHFEAVWIPEYGREYCEDKLRVLTEKNVENPDFDWEWSEDEFVIIAKKQTEMEQDAHSQALKNGHSVYICDTDALATSVWFWRYMGNVYSQHVRDIVTQNMRESPADLYLLTNRSQPFVQDGLRDTATLDLREKMHEIFIQELNFFGAKYIELKGDWVESQQQAIAVIEKLVASEEMKLNEHN